jgi:signal transduction histidine kinase
VRIRASIQYSIAAAALLVLGFALAAFVSSAKLADIAAQQARVQDLSRGVSELLVLAQEYALYSEQRAGKQFLAHQAELATLLRSARSNIVPAPQEALDELSSLEDTFRRLIEADASDASLKIRQKNLLLGQAQASIQLLAESAHRWDDEVGELSKRANGEFRTLAVGMLVLMLLVIALLGALLNRRVLRPLAALEQTMQAVARGDFNARSALAAKDELGDLSRTFDGMALDLVTELRGEIAERRRSEALLRARLNMAQLGRAGSLDELLQAALDAAEEVTGSQIGFFHFVDADQERLTLQAWSSNTLKRMCTAEGKGQHYSVSEAGVWTDCVRTRVAVIHNDYASLAHKKGMPEGHAKVVRELVVPIVRDDKVVAILGVGNKAVDYVQADTEAVQMIAAMAQDIVERSHDERLLALEHAVAHALAFEADKFSGLKVVMREICTSLQWTRSTYWRVDAAAGVMRLDEVWNSPELDMQDYVNEARGVEFAPGVGLVGRVWQSDEPLWIADLTQDPPPWRSTLVSKFGMRGMLAFAIRSEGKTIGVLTFASREVREPDARLLALTRMIGSQLGQFLQRKAAEGEVLKLNAELEERVAERTHALEFANRELESFCSAVSHDLRAPLRTIDGFSDLIGKECAPVLGERGREYLGRVRHAAAQMARLIEDLLKLSQIARVGMSSGPVDLSGLAREIAQGLQAEGGGRDDVEWRIAPGLMAKGDPGLIRVAMQNLLANAWKYSSKRDTPCIEFGADEKDGRREFFVRDNGAGFDMTRSGRLFQPFQRLHTQQEFPGTGIGLATVARVVQRHGGEIRAEGDVDRGASFYFTLQG